MEETYFVIHNGDGDTIVQQFTKKELLDAINENYWGSDIDYLSQIPQNNDTNYWGSDALIIKGSIVTPKAERVITKYNIN